MKKQSVSWIVMVAILSVCLVACGSDSKRRICTVKGCTNSPVKDDDFGEKYCAKHLAQKQAFKSSKKVYSKLNIAQEIVDEIATDSYEAWRLGIFEEKKVKSEGCEYLAQQMNLSAEDLRYGMSFYIAEFVRPWDELSEKEQKELVGQVDKYWSLLDSVDLSFFTMTTGFVVKAYEMNGKTEEIQQCLDSAKKIMKELSNDFSDYEHYPALKGYYTSVVSLFEFCLNPNCSFEQMKTTLEEYRSSIRKYQADLNYIFEE